MGSLCETFCTGDILADLNAMSDHLDTATQLWMALQEAGFSQDVEANLERIGAMQEAIGLFSEWAEIA